MLRDQTIIMYSRARSKVSGQFYEGGGHGGSDRTLVTEQVQNVIGGASQIYDGSEYLVLGQ